MVNIKTLDNNCSHCIVYLHSLKINKKIKFLGNIVFYSRALKGKIGYNDFLKLEKLCNELDAEIVMLSLTEVSE